MELKVQFGRRKINFIYMLVLTFIDFETKTPYYKKSE